MKLHNFKFMAVVLCLLITTLFFPQNALALSTPTAPANLYASALNSSQISLTWNTVSGATTYYIYRGTSSGNYSVVGTTTSSSYIDTGLSSGTAYYYKVQASNSAGGGSYSSIVYAVTLSSNSTLPAPTNLTATASSSSQIYLTWNAVSGATSYYVYRANSPSGPFSMIASPTTIGYTDSGLSANVAYYYKVVARNSYGTSTDSPIVYATTTISSTVPSAPSNLIASVVSSTQIYLSWSAVSNANFYYVYRSTSPYGTYTVVASPTTAYYTDSTVSTNTTYYYKVAAVGNAGPSLDSVITNATTVASGALAAPTNVSAIALASNQVYLSWATVSNATYYTVYRSTSLTGTYTIVGAPATSIYTDSTVSTLTTYYYKVVAIGSSGSSSDSAIVTVTTTYNTGALATPTNVTATTVSTSQIYLTWSAVSNASYYNVYRSTSPSLTYSNIGTVTTPSLTDSSLAANTTYYYKVVAVGSAGSSAESAVVPATTILTNTALSAPTNPTATALSTSQIYLTWDSVSNATSYYVYRATSISDVYTNIATISTLNYTDSNLSSNTTYYYKIQAVGSLGSSPFSAIVSAAATGSGSGSTAPTNPSQTSAQRLAGEDMYGTAAEVAKAEWNTSYFAVIVSGETFSDALCSGPLAAEHNAPLLLTTKDTLNAQTKAQLTRMKVKSVFIVGGVGVISAAVEQSIKDMGIQVTRIAGNDSYETSVKIAQAMEPTSQAVVASGETFPDALSIAPIAAMKGIPILLTPKDTLPSSVKTYLKGIQSTYVVGGTGVISDNVVNQLPSPTRLSGQDRYDTNISIIKEFADQLDFSTCYISTGENYGDALAGSVLASLTSSPVFLVGNPVGQSTLDYMGSISGGIQKEVVFGGTVVVPDSVLTSINGASATNVSTTLSAPRLATASPVSSSQIDLSWDAVSGATSYYIFGSTSSSGTFTHIATVTTNSYSNTGLWADTTYYYKIQAVNGSATGQFSPVASATTSS
ncbi:cell wall-binding repeat-containing protein [Desulfosporosinus sp. SYSU MS00001]|uniref:cell wall-binding repeat-containing protein n=1 Tax=Desulfosporosinus sp. SYSU MS00001 TaxID=3416284 RepID=UPI003CEDFCF2